MMERWAWYPLIMLRAILIATAAVLVVWFFTADSATDREVRDVRLTLLATAERPTLVSFGAPGFTTLCVVGPAWSTCEVLLRRSLVERWAQWPVAIVLRDFGGEPVDVGRIEAELR